MKKSIALVLALVMALALVPTANAAAGRLAMSVTAADVLALTEAPNRYETMGADTLSATSWIVPKFETYGQGAVIGDRMEIRTNVCAESVTDDGIVGMMIFKGTFDEVTENSEPVYSEAYYAVGGHGNYTKVFTWETKGFAAGDYTAFFFVMDEQENIIFSSAADLYLSKEPIPVTGIEIYVYELQDTPDEIYLPQDGAFSYGVVYEPYNTTSDRSVDRNSTGDLTFGGSEKPDGTGLVHVERVTNCASMSLVYEGYQEEGGVLPTDTLNIYIQNESQMAVFAQDQIQSCSGAWTEVPVYAPEGASCMIYNANPYVLETRIENNTLYVRGLYEGAGELAVSTGSAIDIVTVYSCNHICQTKRQSANCTEDGYEWEICEVCGVVVSEKVIPAKGHNPAEVVVVTEPTATKDGLGTGRCTRCDLDVEILLPRIFADTDPDRFYSDAVDYCYTNGIIKGITATTFEPNTGLTRGQLVTMLYRHAGSPEVEKAASFADVPEGKYYTSAVAWASANGVVNGYAADNTFRPDVKVDRAQLVTMIHRYVKLLEKDNGERADLSVFADLDELPKYANDAMAWAVANDVVNGVSADTLGSRQNATRAQTATILYRVITGILEG